VAYQTIPINILADGGINATFVAKFALFIAIMLFGTIATGKILKSLFRLPAVAGQIIGGIFLGPSLLNITKLSYFTSPLEFINKSAQHIYTIASADIFFFFILLISSGLTVAYLLWLAGHETDVQDMAKVGMVSVLAGFLGAIVPIGMTTATIYYLFGKSYSLASAIGLGVVFAATSVSIPITMLISQKKMHLRSSKATMGAAIVDDILAVILFSLFVVLLQSGLFGNVHCTQSFGHCSTIQGSLGRMLLSFIIMFVTGYFLIKPINIWLKKAKLTHLLPSFAALMMLGYFCIAELVGGLAGITGAYFAGLFHRMGDHNHSAERAISPYVNTFLLPLFLGSVGMQVDITVLDPKDFVIVLILLFVAIISKLLGCQLTSMTSNMIGRSKKWSLLETYIFGSSMVARGEVGLVIATILNGTNLITPQQYVICVAVIVLTTIASPIMLALGFSQMEKERKEKHMPKKEIYSIKIGPFKYLPVRLIFNAMVSILEKTEKVNSIVQLDEGKKVLTLTDNVKIFFKPDQGIILEGNKDKIHDILNNFDENINKDIKQIHKSLS